ncbi:MAG TPA: tyrosine-type recombinase/integrase [Streptosporangiaceae bacterium]|nr:tyrosine-type recombinase/integrase [Streptosporangiaceae bacterium]
MAARTRAAGQPGPAQSAMAAAWSSGRSRNAGGRPSNCSPSWSPVLKSHRAAQAAERLAAANVWEDHDLVFCQPNGRPVGQRADWQEWADILKAAGLPHHGVHAMRHSAATIALGEGVALAVVQEMLGHSDIRVTRGYTHVSSPLAEDAAARVGRALFGPTATKTATRRPR